jgi:uncharacterized caspase-like protein
VALCIGIDDYGGRNSLPNCVNDATDMGACAQRIGFEYVQVLRDSTQKEIMREIRRLRDERIRPGSLVLLYFSGHGAEHEGVTTCCRVVWRASIRMTMRTRRSR